MHTATSCYIVQVNILQSLYTAYAIEIALCVTMKAKAYGCMVPQINNKKVADLCRYNVRYMWWVCLHIHVWQVSQVPMKVNVNCA